MCPDATIIYQGVDSFKGAGSIGHSLPQAGGFGAESTGVLDISTLVGYNPGSIVLSNNQGFFDSSLSVLINPNWTLATAAAVAVAAIPEPSTFALATLTLLGIAWRRRKRV